jgi:hypothetical protein
MLGRMLILPILNSEEPDWDSGTILEQEPSGIDKFAKAFIRLMNYKPVDWGWAQTMNSGLAYLGGKLV